MCVCVCVCTVHVCVCVRVCSVVVCVCVCVHIQAKHKAIGYHVASTVMPTYSIYFLTKSFASQAKLN